MSTFKDLLGRRFGRLLVIKHIGPDKHRKHMWECLCDCGNSATVTGSKLLSGNTKSCKCLNRDRFKEMLITHGKSGTIEHRIFHAAKGRAKRKNIPFNLVLEDISIPEFCPVFTTVRLNTHTVRPRFDSPSLDRLIPYLGYVKGNVRVISNRANIIKQDATWQELLAVSNWLKGETYAPR